MCHVLLLPTNECSKSVPILFMMLKSSCLKTQEHTQSSHCIKGKNEISCSYHRLSEGSCKGEEQGHEPPAAVDGGIHHIPRMQCVTGDAEGRHAAVQLVGEEDVAEFGTVVGQH